MIRRIFYLVSVISFCFLTSGCSPSANHSSSNESDGKTDSNIVEPSITDIEAKTSKCTLCERLYASFPTSKQEFDSLYAYNSKGEGRRYGHEDEDFSSLIECLRNCYDSSVYKNALLLGSMIEFDADAPMVLQYHLTNYSMAEPELFINVQRNMKQSEKLGIVTFLLQGIPPNDNFREKLCEFLLESYDQTELENYIQRKCPSIH